MRHVAEVDGLSMLVESAGGAVALVISEAVLDADNDPVHARRKARLASCGVDGVDGVGWEV